MSRAAASCRRISNTSKTRRSSSRRFAVVHTCWRSTTVLNDTTVLTLRYGWQTWRDQTDTATFGPGLGSLGFSSNYVNAVNEAGRTMFPELLFDDIDDRGGWGGDRTRWTGPYAINGTLETDGRAQPQVRR